jgi:hypothetical protein
VTAGLASLDDLRRAYRATQTIDLGPEPASTIGSPPRWTPAVGERVLLVCGCGGASGATTIALALATASGRARVVETCGATESGLGYAAAAELGVANRGWLRGSRESVVVERRADSLGAPDRVPSPTDSDVPLTVVDSSWDLGGVLASPGWLGQLAREASPVVLVARATVPGLRRLASAVELVGEPRTIAVTVGPKRWPRPVEQSATPAVRSLREAGRVVTVPELASLALSGLTPDALPQAILRPARTLLNLLEGRLP